MNTTYWRLMETMKGTINSINTPREFVKWVLTGCAAMIGLTITNAANILPIIGKPGLSLGVTFLTFAVVSGFLAMIAANAIEGLRNGILINEDINESKEWAEKLEQDPFDEKLFNREYEALIFGPIKALRDLMLKDLEGPKELIISKVIGRAMSTFVLFSMLQIVFSFTGIMAMVVGMWFS